MELIKEIWHYYEHNGSYVLSEIFRHFLMSAYGVLFAAIIAIPLGIFLARYSRLSPVVFSIVNIIQTIPALAMLAVLMLVMGLGPNTVVMALFLYSILPILRNTYTGILSVDKALTESGNGMGMTKFQLLRMVELPLALSVIIAGLRTALVIGISIATIGAFIGAGGLGDIIIRGTNAADGTAIILAGAIPTALIAVFADLFMGWIEKQLNHETKIKRRNRTA